MRATHRFRATVARSALALLLLLALATAGYALDRQLHPESSPANAPAAKRGKPAFKVSGTMKGLYPGANKQLTVKVKNRHSFTIAIRKVSTKIKSPVRGCSAKVVKVKTWKGKKKIRARRSAKIKTRIGMKPAATDACQGVRFRLTYRVKAVNA